MLVSKVRGNTLTDASCLSRTGHMHSIWMQANHFPGTWQLGRKDKLYTNIAKAKRMRGAFFDIIPKFYILPRDRQELKQYAHPDQLYIQKVSQSWYTCLIRQKCILAHS